MFAQAASEKQSPHTLFITCADSRIDPIAITSSSTGEIFVARNIGNMVPAYGEMLGGVSAVIEFAVSSLGVRHIVVCGHTHCGAMQGLLDPESVAKMPTVKSWLRNAHAALSVAETLHEQDDERAHAAELDRYFDRAECAPPDATSQDAPFGRWGNCQTGTDDLRMDLQHRYRRGSGCIGRRAELYADRSRAPDRRVISVACSANLRIGPMLLH